jgi:hypothetical protein
MAQLVLANILAGSGNVLAGGDNDGNVTKVTIGTNLTLSGGVLSASGGATLSLTTTGTSGVATYTGGVLNIPNYTYTLPTASTTVLGGVKVDGTTITISGGVISSAAGYTLPTASSTVLGGVKIGSGVTITSGVISVSTNYQAPLNGTGFVVASGTTISYDNTSYASVAFTNATYLKISDASATYLPLAGGTMSGNIYFPNNGTGLIWGSNYSKIYDNANLHIFTDDVTNFESGNGSGPFYWRTGVSNSGTGGTTRMTLTGPDLSVTGNVTASGFFRIGGSSSEFLKADGSVDSTVYASTGYVNATFLTTSAASSIYFPISGGTFTGGIIGTTAQFTGYVRQINYIYTNTSSYTLVSTDVSKNILMNVSSANTVTIPNDSSVNFTIGTEINVFQYGTGATTIVGAGGVSLRSRLNLTKIGGQYTGVTLMKTGSNEWLIVGSLSS